MARKTFDSDPRSALSEGMKSLCNACLPLVSAGELKRGSEANWQSDPKNSLTLFGFKFYFSAVPSSNDAMAKHKS